MDQSEPFVKKQRVTIFISNDAIKYFRKLSSETSIPYQTLINHYLVDCAKNEKKIDLGWK